MYYKEAVGLASKTTSVRISTETMGMLDVIFRVEDNPANVSEFIRVMVAKEYPAAKVAFAAQEAKRVEWIKQMARAGNKSFQAELKEMNVKW